MFVLLNYLISSEVKQLLVAGVMKSRGRPQCRRISNIRSTQSLLVNTTHVQLKTTSY